MKKNAFTIIELLLVIAITEILAGPNEIESVGVVSDKQHGLAASPEEAAILKSLDNYHFIDISRGSNDIIAQACHIFASGEGQLFLTCTASNSEGLLGWRYLLIRGKQVEYIWDMRLDDWRRPPRAGREKVKDLRIGHWDGQNYSPFTNAIPTQTKLILQFQVEGKDSYYQFK